MENIGRNSFDIGYLDTLSRGESFLHKLDPRAKLLTTLIFIVTVVSFNKYSLSAMIPFFIYPIVLIAAGGLPEKYLLKKVLLVSPFALIIAMFNPLIDRAVMLQLGPIGISGGWVSFFSILVRFVLTVSAALILVSLTGFNAVCLSLKKLGMPKPFVMQLMFFFRYLFVLTDEAERMARARSFRSLNSAAMPVKTFVPWISHLLLRSLDRAERIYLAMCSRGFTGHIHIIKEMDITYREVLFVAGWSAVFLLLRFYNLPLILGSSLTRWYS